MTEPTPLAQDLAAQVQEITTALAAWDAWEAATPTSATEVAAIRTCGRRWRAQLVSMQSLLRSALALLDPEVNGGTLHN